MPTLEIVLPSLHPGQARIVQSARRFNILACGRRFGKTTLCIDRLAQPEVLRYPMAWFAPRYKDLLEVWREAVALFHPITARRNAQERRIELITGGLVEFWSLDNPDAGRGRKYRRIVVDEAAMVPDLMDIFMATLRPTLVDYEGDFWAPSTPKGMNGFWQMFQWGLDEEREDWACWQMPTSANPHIPESEIEAMRRTMPERIYEQEVLATFLESAGGVFRRVREAATATRQMRAQEGHEYVIGVDWAQMVDFTVFTVLDITTNEVVATDRFQQVDYGTQVNRLQALVERFPPVSIIAEVNSIGRPVIERLHALGLPVQPFLTTQATKHEAIKALALAFEVGELRIPPDEVLIGELQAYEGRVAANGLMSYSAPEGMHDDMVMSLALAWQGAATMMPAFL